MINMWMFLPYMNVYFKTSKKIYRQFTSTKLEFRKKVADYGFIYKES